MIDLVTNYDQDVASHYRTMRRENDRLVSEPYLPDFCSRGPTWLWNVAAPLYDESGEVVGAIEVIREITEIKRAEEALRRSEEQYRQIVENASELIYRTDHLGYCQLVNSVALRMLGYAEQELMGRRVMELAAPEYQERAERFYRAQFVKKTPETYLEFPVITKEGGIVWLGQSTQLIMDGDRVVGFQSIARNISERRLAEENLSVALETAEQLRDEAQAADRAKSEFLANMSHEIRTPLNAIVGLTDLALRLDLAPKLADYLTKIRASSQSLTRTVNDVLDFSRIEAGHLEMEYVHFDLMQVISSMSDKICASEASRGTEFLVSVDPDVPRGLIGDPFRLEQILTNLADNAVKFTPEGEVLVRIEPVEVLRDEATLRFSVRDTGIGIPADRLDSLFAPFTQADGSTTRQFGVSGLGLTISNRLVRMMGGTIQVESELGKGSTFSFQLQFDVHSDNESVLPTVAADMHGIRILAVDDNATAREILLQILESFSVQATAVGSGEEALQELIAAQGDGSLFPRAQRPYDLVLLDWNMSPMNGMETALSIDELPQLQGSIRKIIMVSEDDLEEVSRKAKAAGLDGILVKPFRRSSLLKAIMEALGEEHDRKTIRKGLKGADRSQSENVRGTKILVAEDSEINQQVAREILESGGGSVLIASNGKEALEAVNQSEFDAMLVDIQMPEMDGYEATRAIRTNPALKDLPIIAMTAHAMKGDREKCLEAGIDDHVPKPIDADDPFATLGEWLHTGSVGPRTLPKESQELETDEDKEGVLTTLRGIDGDAALRRLRGNRTLFKKLLLSFRQQFLGATDKIRQSWIGGDRESVQTTAHQVSGVAGNLRAMDVYRDAKDLRRAVTEGRDESVTGLINRLEASLYTVVDSIATIEDPDTRQAHRGRQDPVADLDSRKALQSLPKELYETLTRAAITADFDLVMQVIGQIRDHDEPVADALTDLAQGYRFDTIQELLEASQR